MEGASLPVQVSTGSDTEGIEHVLRYVTYPTDLEEEEEESEQGSTQYGTQIYKLTKISATVIPEINAWLK